MTRLLLVPLEDVVVFPGMSLTLAVDAGKEETQFCSSRATTTSSPRSAPSPRSPITSASPAAPTPLP